MAETIVIKALDYADPRTPLESRALLEE